MPLGGFHVSGTDAPPDNTMIPLQSPGVFLPGVLLVLVMPGPTNTLLATAGLASGFRRSARLTLAESCGYLIAISFWGMSLATLGQSLPWLPVVIRAGSALYIAYLAMRLWNAKLELADGAHNVIDMRDLFFATLLNPKAILFGGTIFPKAAFASGVPWLEAMGLFLAVVFPVGLLWIGIGARLGAGRAGSLMPTYLFRSASLILGAFSITVALSALR
ncbi:threonine/homoserine/homoserine lactone efflux protein [Paraburkholderia eburnea]|uniref:Threonine/homoserine/homoserine lactone efflux protein n=2 Tax=Paraburkholderia eburnea TaxID=1189126 RepID=A0A2S4M243_9BURK|nr:threonine/homoserine/homoserine lactone efflux protein [Paraburkholderia eburnea]